MLVPLLLAVVVGLPPVHIDVLAGRADLASPLGIVPLRPGAKPIERNGPGYLELGAISRLNLRWRSVASIELEGAAAIEWRGSQGDEDALSLEVLRLDELSAEVRRGPLRLELPGGWRATLTHGALHVRTLSDGTLELEHIAGAPLLVAPGPVDGFLPCASAPTWAPRRSTLADRALYRSTRGHGRSHRRSVHNGIRRPWPSSKPIHETPRVLRTSSVAGRAIRPRPGAGSGC